MKLPTLLIITILCLTSICYGQKKEKIPKNLKQAIVLLDKDCTDSLKKIIKETNVTELKKLSYPWGGDYKTIHKWTSADNSKIERYLTKRGVSSHQETVILIAYKHHLLGKEINEEEILLPYQNIEKKWAEEDKVRFTTDSLRGIYIPKDLKDCFIQINKSISDSTKVEITNWEEKEMSRLHFGFGMWMRNNWQLWGGSRLSNYFNEMEIYHPDDMSGIILTSYHRDLNKKDLKLDEQIKYYVNYWKSAKEDEIRKRKEQFAEYKVGTTVLFLYNNGFVSEKQEELYDDDTCIAKGIVTELNNEDFFIKVKLIESCDKKGIIFYDNVDVVIYNPETRKTSKPKKRIIKRMKKGKEQWFEYRDWETED
ncbi:hypothetical protein GWA97_13400 [Flavobacterium sp. LaA7.5]|nr:hypothetical protein [Flavobacterium salilacus subsp. altitudinum]